jgi:glyoxylase-like metal-dependent hydrolase (beta-lactamase superfamily II)
LFVSLSFTSPSFAGTLDDIAKTMGADKVKSLDVTGSGLYYHLGGSGIAGEQWPKFNLKKYHQQLDYDAPGMKLDLVLTQALFPPRGAGFQPIRGTKTRRWYLNGTTGWGLNRKGKAREGRSAARALHAMWTTPHGVVKALQKANATFSTKSSGGKTYNTATFGSKGAFTALAWFSKEGLLRGVDAKISNDIYGDMHSTTVYMDYKIIDGVQFPTTIKVTYGPHPAFELNAKDVKINASVDVALPEKVGKRKYGVKSKEVAPGIWYLRGSSHHSVAIEMKDHAVVYEGPLNDARGSAVYNAVRKLIPSKKIKYVINSHHHFDHSGGLRAFASKGVPILTHETNKPFYTQAYAGKDMVNPDMLAKSGKRAKFITMDGKKVMSDGSRTIELYSLKGNVHAETNIIAYLPKEKILIVADAYSARKIYKKPVNKKKIHPARAQLWKTLSTLGLDIETVLPIHGKKVDIEQIRFAAGLE